jgi:hypothetical protein
MKYDERNSATAAENARLPEENPRFPGHSKYRSFAVAGLGVRPAMCGRCDRDEFVRIVAPDRIGIIMSGKRNE